MSFDEIMNSIKLGLTGDVEKDVIYIMQKNAEYKKSPFADRINKETGKMIYDMLPDEEKELFAKVLQCDDNEINAKIQEIEKAIFDGNYAVSAELSEKIINGICEESQVFENCDYLSLNNLFEMCIYTNIYKKNRLVKPTPFNFAHIYRLYAFSLYKLSKDDDAEKAYEKALLWNPINVEIMLDLAELKYIKKQYKSFIELIKKALKYSYNINHISLCYFNMGRYYYQKENYDYAMKMYILSHYFKPNKAVFKRLENMAKEKNIKIVSPSVEKMKEFCDSIDFQLGVNPEIAKVAAKMGTEAKKAANIEVARYFYDILFALTGDKAVMDTVFDYMKHIKDDSDKNKSNLNNDK